MKTKRKKTMTYKIILEREAAGGYSAYAPELPGCASQGETVAEATANIKKAIKLYLWSLKKDQQPLRLKAVLVKDVAA
jgi:predicted RNase H-like HicB family nuclease